MAPSLVRGAAVVAPSPRSGVVSNIGPKLRMVDPSDLAFLSACWKSSDPSGRLATKISMSAPRSAKKLSMVYSSLSVVERKRQPDHQSRVNTSKVRPCVASVRPRAVNVMASASASSASCPDIWKTR